MSSIISNPSLVLKNLFENLFDLYLGTKGDLIDKVNEEYQRYPEVVNPKQSFSQKLNQKQCVKKKDIIEFCKKYKIKYFKASSKSNENVHDLF